MTNIHDIAAYILQNQGAMSTMKLQRLMYYLQAWHITLRGKPLYQEKILAWAFGPIVYELFKEHHRLFMVSQWPLGDAKKVVENDADFIMAVLSYYGKYNSEKLSEIINSEEPWQQARKAFMIASDSEQIITHEAMQAFYRDQPPPFKL
ncbi:MAG: DUF4065 domain-containing protein [Deltaproteobacteria bacterium]|nr:DUF4065 domain-containing protein [Deltaproteobacteria bacterium]